MSETVVPLSRLLRVAVQVSVFEELSNLKQLEETTSETLLKHDLLKTEQSLSEMVAYLNRLLEAFQGMQVQLQESLDWIYEGRSEVYEINRNLDIIDTIVADLVVIVETKLSSSPDEASERFTDVLVSLSDICELSLKVKKYSLVLKKKADMSAQYHELRSGVLGSIGTEIEQCLKDSHSIHETRLSSPVRRVPQFTLEDLTQKMKPPGNASLSSLRLPTFNEIDELLYTQFRNLESRLSPLNASLIFVPQALEQFSVSALELYPDSISELLDAYEGLRKKFAVLSDETEQLRIELVQQRWLEIFGHLIAEVALMMDDVEKELRNSDGQISHVCSYKIETIDETLDILKRAVAEGLIENSSINHDKNTLIKRLFTVKDQVFQIEKSAGTGSRHSSYELEASPADVAIEPSFLKRPDQAGSSREKRRVSLKAGSSFAASMNLKPILIEHNPVSPDREPEKTTPSRPALGETSRHNILSSADHKLQQDGEDSLAYGIQRMSLHKEAATKTTIHTPLRKGEDNIFLTPALRSRYLRRQSMIPVPTPQKSVERSGIKFSTRPADSTRKSRIPVPTGSLVRPGSRTANQQTAQGLKTSHKTPSKTPNQRPESSLQRPDSATKSRIPQLTPIRQSIPVRSLSALAVARERSIPRARKPSEDEFF
ncbi:unnamed protein product [Kuraishia capsulata CBS 1993]|uniref:Karyogamy protein n=1 Tax=Kuraishia capsulata CBS 1993 TaxID=1382522 RepID=W6MFD5_9ASCO|nr:uncharacterized protein KUCA_T00000206001 [Kuraishia capsulata CBS 1993]CDK24246.1 unnamed protein product [Kuraishia capsulata CBS 1993]